MKKQTQEELEKVIKYQGIYFNERTKETQEWQEQEERDALHIDLDCIGKLISEFDNELVTVRHCCTHEGEGYFAIYSTKKKRFTRSEYHLQLQGMCWSSTVWIRLYTGQQMLNKYLKAIENELLATNRNVRMEIRQLYIPWITDISSLSEKHDDDMFSEYDDIMIKYYLSPRVENYNKEHQSEIQLFKRFKNWYEYYNEGCYEYDIVRKILDKAVCDIYENRKALVECGLWDKSRSIIDAMNDILFERGNYLYLRNK